jgi:MptA/FolE2 family GTP cyclohydrolase
MNAVLKSVPLPDVQAERDARNLAIEAAGVKDVRLPVTIAMRDGPMPTVASFSMTVGIEAAARGTHMSRFIEMLESEADVTTPHRVRSLLSGMLERLGAASGRVEVRFPCFLPKCAPVSGARSRLDYEVTWDAMLEQGRQSFAMTVKVPVTSLCPCSKAISKHGAHNQRSLITITAELASDMPIEELIAVAERNASCELYGILKRADEKFVTERAYENPKFAEDLVRDIALDLARDSRVRSYAVEAENLESIHNHSAYARLRGRPGGAQ